MYTFCIWMIGSGLFAVFGALAWRRKKAVRFWNISQEIRVSNVQKYNRAVAKMWFVFSGIFTGIGLPVLAKNPAWIAVTILGAMFSVIALMVVYTVIEKKYRIQ